MRCGGACNAALALSQLQAGSSSAGATGAGLRCRLGNGAGAGGAELREPLGPPHHVLPTMPSCKPRKAAASPWRKETLGVEEGPHPRVLKIVPTVSRAACFRGPLRV
jgi:hypothetical protein